MTYILNKIDTIRDYINSPRKQHILISQKADWNKLCSSLDVVGDTELAVESYLKCTKSKTVGETYLIIYGILQVLFVQQDAVAHIAESLQLQYTVDPLLIQVRDIRNDSIGHPTKRGAGKGAKFNFINRSSMSTAGFQLMTTYADGLDSKFTTINIPSLIASHRKKICSLLSNIIKSLKEEEMKHRKTFKKEKLTEIFPQTLEYYCSKIYESIDGDMPKSFGTSMVKLINNHISKFKLALDRRGMLKPLDNVNDIIDQLIYPLEKLESYFGERIDPAFNDKDARIFNYFVHEHLRKLREIAEEIDIEYSKKP